MNITVKNVPKLRFKEFSGEWKDKKIIDIADYVDYRGKTPKKTKSGILLITAKNIKKGYLDYDISQEFIDENDLDSVMSRGKVELHDILITTEAPLGNVAQVDRIDIALAQRVIKYRGKDNILINSFLLQKLLSDDFQNTLLTKATGGTVKGIKGSILHQIKLSIPVEIKEQQKIADFLSSVDNKIQALKQQQQLLLQYKKGMMQKLFSQQIRFKDENGQDYPEWELYKLSDISEINPRNEILPKEFVYIDLESVEKGNLIHQKHVLLNNAPSRAQRILKKNDILFQLVRPYQQNNFLFNLDNNNYVASTGYAQIRTKQNQEYLYQLLNTDFILNKVIELCTGTSYPAINSNDLGSISFNICSFPEQQKIADCLSVIDQKIELVNKKISYTEQFKQGLLQQLFV